MGIHWSLPPLPVIHAWEAGTITLSLRDYVHVQGSIFDESNYASGESYTITQPVGQGFEFPEPSYFRDDGSISFVFTVRGSYPDWVNIPRSWWGQMMQRGIHGGATASFTRVLFVEFEGDPARSGDPPYAFPPCPDVDCTIGVNRGLAQQILEVVNQWDVWDTEAAVTAALRDLDQIADVAVALDPRFPEWISRLDKFRPFGKTETDLLETLKQLPEALAMEERLTALATDLTGCCAVEPFVALPDWKQRRPGAFVPQLVVIYSPKDEKTGAWLLGNFPITIPWAVGVPASVPHWKGPAYGRLTLPDNSKLIVNCISVAQAQALVSRLKALIPSALTQAATASFGNREGISVAKVWPRKAVYFSAGPSHPVPDWVKPYA